MHVATRSVRGATRLKLAQVGLAAIRALKWSEAEVDTVMIGQNGGNTFPSLD